jgi:hypothetical protein
MGYALDIFAAFLSGGALSRELIRWHPLTPEHRDAIRTHLVERYEERTPRGRRRSNPVSVNNRLAAWRGVLRHAWDKGLMTIEDLQRVSKVARLPGRREPKRRFAAEERSLSQQFRQWLDSKSSAARRRSAGRRAWIWGRRCTDRSLSIGIDRLR